MTFRPLVPPLALLARAGGSITASAGEPVVPPAGPLLTVTLDSPLAAP